MAADIINLNRARKDKARAEKTAKAAENRVKFGRSKAEKTKIMADKERRQRELEGARRAIGPDHPDCDLDPGTVS
ncbi:MAG: hypothetical protein CTY20_13220 [Hyphomicrobium sp.]|nr:MAG: hypothetical protein CTY20_13220 [Hyphomicrobium sp.]